MIIQIAGLAAVTIGMWLLGYIMGRLEQWTKIHADNTRKTETSGITWIDIQDAEELQQTKHWNI